MDARNYTFYFVPFYVLISILVLSTHCVVKILSLKSLSGMIPMYVLPVLPLAIMNLVQDGQYTEPNG